MVMLKSRNNLIVNRININNALNFNSHSFRIINLNNFFINYLFTINYFCYINYIDYLYKLKRIMNNK